jgi:hypothetical protein
MTKARSGFNKKLLNTPIPEIKIVNPIVFVNEMEK